jgi:hypothetical protein
MEGYNNASASGTTKVAGELQVTLKSGVGVLHPVHTLMQNLHINREPRSKCGSTTSNSRPLKSWRKHSRTRVKHKLCMHSRNDCWPQLLQSPVKTSTGGVQLKVKSPDSAIQCLSVLHQNPWVVATTHIGGANSSVGSISTLPSERDQDLSVGRSINSSRGIRNVPVYRIL